MTPANPYRTALKLVGILGLSIGALLLLIGTAIQNTANQQYLQYGNLPDPLAWDPVLGAGSWLGGLGLAALLLWLVVSSIGWNAALAPVVDDSEEARARPLEEVRAELARRATAEE